MSKRAFSWENLPSHVLLQCFLNVVGPEALAPVVAPEQAPEEHEAQRPFEINGGRASYQVLPHDAFGWRLQDLARHIDEWERQIAEQATLASQELFTQLQLEVQEEYELMKTSLIQGFKILWPHG
ncbi:hypothetical protein CYMTET_34443 [Cymbomonas tetramitiformis]|uniref:Uncharacterized protein n=1 Tax=Cymbomonas tetramitiformis TaxID=36881 RepID=A0AAE0FB49_9CHLO|nr:hypothetical protein CYMTET_34443 [Cymbomonas tetramitiformis]